MRRLSKMRMTKLETINILPTILEFIRIIKRFVVAVVLMDKFLLVNELFMNLIELICSH